MTGFSFSDRLGDLHASSADDARTTGTTPIFPIFPKCHACHQISLGGEPKRAGNHSATRAQPPRITRSLGEPRVVVSPGVVIASAPCAAPHSTAHAGPRPVRKP